MRRTGKYVAAEAIAEEHDLNLWKSQDELYQILRDIGYMWDSKTGKWLFLPEMAADAPSPLIKMRVWADALIVDKVASEIVSQMKDKATLVDRSEIYPCRPPKQKEGRVYLTFK